MTFSSIANIEVGVGNVDRSRLTFRVLGLEGTHCAVVSPLPPAGHGNENSRSSKSAVVITTPIVGCVNGCAGGCMRGYISACISGNVRGCIRGL